VKRERERERVCTKDKKIINVYFRRKEAVMILCVGVGVGTYSSFVRVCWFMEIFNRALRHPPLYC